MTLRPTNKPAWTAGTLMLPQHLQQQDRHHTSVLHARLSGAAPLAWGVLTLEVDTRQLQTGMVAIAAFEGVFPDGTVVSVGGGRPHLRPKERALGRHFPPSQRSVSVYLGLPTEREGVNNYGEGDAMRFSLQSQPVFDASADDRSETISLLSPRPSLLFGDESLDAYVTIKVAEVTRDARGELTLSTSYIPPCLQISASPALRSRLERLLAGMVTRHRTLSEARRVTNEGRVEFTSADVTRYLQLSALNTGFPLLHYVLQRADLGPRETYLQLAQLAGQLATFSPDVDMTTPMPFEFLDLERTFDVVISLIERLLEIADTERFVALALVVHEGGRYFGDFAQVRIENCERYFLAIESPLPRPVVVQDFVKRAKVASHDDMDIVLSTAVGGVTLNECTRPPTELPVRPNMVYFELPSKQNDVYWKHILNDKNLVVWIPTTLEQARPAIRLYGTLRSR
jgi:type VI secretion system protein ImpJ